MSHPLLMVGYVFMKTETMRTKQTSLALLNRKCQNHFIINFSEMIPSSSGFIVNLSRNPNRPFLYCSGFRVYCYFTTDI